MAREFRTVGVVGLGTMGAGIVEVFARNGLDVVAVEITEAALDRGRGNLTGSTDRAVKRGKLAPADRDALLSRVTFAVGLDALRETDLVIEAVPERLDIKQRLFADLDRTCKPATVLATNTSSLSVTEIAAATGRPEQVVGMHFFNPAPVMRLVEVIRTVVTAPEVVADVEALCARLGKTDVTVDDRAGFIVNALLLTYLNQAAGLVEAGHVGREDLDTAMRLGGGLPMGPLALLDLIGLDTAYEILETMYRRGGRDRRHAPVPLLRQMVTAGWLGRKSGRGFYTYEKPGSAVVVPDETTPFPEPAGDAAQIATVGVVGSGEPARRLVGLFTDAGYDVVAVTGDLDRLADVDLVVTAGAGGPDADRALFAGLDKVCKPGALLATSTTRLPVIDLAMATGRPADVVGLRFLDPAPDRALAEIVHTVRTAPATTATARAVCARLGRAAVVCADRAGYVVDALLFPYLNDAVRMLESSYSTADDIDHAMKLGCGYPAGPFELLDRVGPDVALETLRALYRQSREPGLAPAPLLEQLVTAGRGFRTHPRD
ncbi:3-hydroxyacyl-CoA dehydrogenase family protein [Polymorphospora rubra]|uniref:3-hydroxybutyryl-CoA dehydrogenase n=1 Tax=Polymorphospora rubra TaxID=338584 RepID=A0A810MZP5_9ACTN|nr:3-hydroxyacyl-CoA dehydrogenase [Polymorphospora rubra]BCJ66771.1 3-hydroxybutyryl-CoA dehydrogenase [Polymorphospora rubra]